MKKIVTLFLATSAMVSMVQADAYTPTQEDSFFWSDAAPTPQPHGQATTGKKDAGLVPPARGKKDDPKTSLPQNPVMTEYPKEEAPAHRAPEAGHARYMDDHDCYGNPNSPYASIYPNRQVQPYPSERSHNPSLERRGEMVGDDGILEAIQDTPCTVIHRRGGENAASWNSYTHPDDIRRVNTLEERRIPVHSVGSYTTERSSLWHHDPSNPFKDSARQWRVQQGMMLSQLLSQWGEQAGYTVVWRSAHDYIIQTDVVITGTFPEAAGQVLESFRTANPPVSGDFYPSNRALVIESASEFDAR